MGEGRGKKGMDLFRTSYREEGGGGLVIRLGFVMYENMIFEFFFKKAKGF